MAGPVPDLSVTGAISWPTLAALVAVLGGIATVIRMLRGQGGRALKIDQTMTRVELVGKDLEDLKSSRTADREKDRQNLEGHLAALHGAVAMLKDQAAEFRVEVAKHYATRASVEHVDSKVDTLQDRIYDLLEKIRDQVDAIRDAQK